MPHRQRQEEVAMTDTPEEQRAVPEAEPPAIDTKDLDVPEAEAEAVEGGSSGAGAGKVIFNPFSITR